MAQDGVNALLVAPGDPDSWVAVARGARSLVCRSDPHCSPWKTRSTPGRAGKSIGGPVMASCTARERQSSMAEQPLAAGDHRRGWLRCGSYLTELFREDIRVVGVGPGRFQRPERCEYRLESLDLRDEAADARLRSLRPSPDHWCIWPHDQSAAPVSDLYAQSTCSRRSGCCRPSRSFAPDFARC